MGQLKNFDSDICVVGGAGHVGLPLALVFASRGMRVIVYDISEPALEKIRAGELPALELGAEPLLRDALANGLLELTSNPAEVSRARNVVITIGTPVDEFLNPVHRVVHDCLDALLPHIVDEQLIVLRSTVFPGTTEWLHTFLQDAGKDVLISFCPERVVQGFAIREVQDMPQIVSATTPKALEAARALFGKIAPETVVLRPMEAELAKLYNNCYRYIQFSIANQFFMIADAAGLDYQRIHKAMTHNYPRAKDMPRPGFTSGPCLFKDTMQLTAFARNQFELGHAAMLANEGMVLYVIEKMKRDYPLRSMTVGILGMAFKADSDDRRASLSYKLKKHLMLHARDVLTTDPLVSDDPELRPVDEVVQSADILVLGVPHASYRTLSLGGKPLVDVWNYIEVASARGSV